MNINTITLNEIADPTFVSPSIIYISLALNYAHTSAFSLPPFLFYAFKAITVLKHGYSSEVELQEKNPTVDVRAQAVLELRELARTHHANVSLGLIDFKKASADKIRPFTSPYVQEYIFREILNLDGIVGELSKNWQEPAEDLYVIRVKKSVTLPCFLYAYFRDELFDSTTTANMLIYDRMVEVYNELKEVDGLSNSHQDKRGNVHLKPPYDCNSWAKKLHNKLYKDVILLNSNVNEGMLSKLLNVELIRETTMEKMK
ncbi:MAG: hypothetical protein HAW67_04430 [Endozoicomonadaceae bacterium]|nr:hypothetical protein [Endozoicomonadaceae bacterium]